MQKTARENIKKKRGERKRENACGKNLTKGRSGIPGLNAWERLEDLKGRMKLGFKSKSREFESRVTGTCVGLALQAKEKHFS